MTTSPNKARCYVLGMLAASPLQLSTMRLPRQNVPDSRPIPTTGELLPMIGLGSWISFNVGDDLIARDASAKIMRSFFQTGAC